MVPAGRDVSGPPPGGALSPGGPSAPEPARADARPPAADAGVAWAPRPDSVLSLEVMLAGAPLPLARVVQILRDVAYAVDQLAQQGKVYGAISPSTIAVDTKGHAHLVPPDEVEALRAGYLAPEQRHGAAPEAHLDQYALAIVAYELLTGERREARMDDAPTLEVVNELRLGPEHPLRPGIGPGANEVLRRATARDPAWRFGTATEFVESLATQLDVPPPATVADEHVLERVAAARLARVGRSSGPSGPSPASRLLGLLAYGIVMVGAVIGLTMVGLRLSGRSFGGPPTAGGARPSLVARLAGMLGIEGGGSGAAAPAATAATGGFLRVSTDGGTATILLDGRPAGAAPAIISATPGFHTVALQAEGRSYSPAVVTVRVAAGDTASASFSGQ